MIRGLLLALLLVANGRAAAQVAPAWRDSFQSRVEILALLQTLNADILASSSATLTLERWCRDHRMAAEPKIVAVRGAVAAVPAPAEVLGRLEVAREDEVKYRHVQLRCGVHVLSEADNWYVPGRLSGEMNRLLETTDTPFGKAVQPLVPYRRTFSARMLWTPLPAGWEQQRRHARRCWRCMLVIPHALFEHRAVLYTKDHVPFSEVHETYTSSILAFDHSLP